MVVTKRLSFSLPAEFGHRNITPEVRAVVEASGIRTGLVAVHSVGSTGAVTTIEYESGTLADLRRAIDRVAPADGSYEHDRRWGDGNGFSHVRSALLKTGITIPVVEGGPALGTWQQVVLLNLDNRDRTRDVVVVASGE